MGIEAKIMSIMQWQTAIDSRTQAMWTEPQFACTILIVLVSVCVCFIHLLLSHRFAPFAL